MTVEQEPDVEPEPEAPPKRVRVRKPPPGADDRGHVERVNEDGTPRYSPYVTTMSAKAERTVRTGQYESFSLSTLVTFEPDRRFSIAQNATNLNLLVTDEVNRVADEVTAKFQVEK